MAGLWGFVWNARPPEQKSRRVTTQHVVGHHAQGVEVTKQVHFKQLSVQEH
jgi:hypothetical protein